MRKQHHVDSLVSKLHQNLGLFYRNRNNSLLICRNRAVEVVFRSVFNGNYGDDIYRSAAPAAKSNPSIWSIILLLDLLQVIITIIHNCTVYCMINWIGTHLMRCKITNIHLSIKLF